ncbi:unnamed protein product [Spirodela intermedia]|uniref:Uncharacterized protein n=1 Tax=Spirodela intermedia TaxID=51605 RepID=A0A7I8IFY7_SPIIN|nr:unnamed protein product [Spirodela intermedia]CAA6656802.1 unnamed protein product [Spirodela intermedia]
MDIEACGGGEEGWQTPRRMECRIPAAFPCPPPPRKKSPVVFAKRREPPKNGYFQPPTWRCSSRCCRGGNLLRFLRSQRPIRELSGAVQWACL